VDGVLVNVGSLFTLVISIATKGKSKDGKPSTGNTSQIKV